MTKQVINIGTTANDGTGDPLRIAFDRTNDNFNELYNALGNSQNPIDLFDNNGALDLLGKPHKVSFLYNTEADLLAIDPSVYHGAIGHAHDTGSLYYAHGSWRRLLSDTSGGTILNYTDPLAPHVYANNVTNSETSDYVLKTNADGTYTWVAQSSGGSYGDTEVDTHLNQGSAGAGQLLSWDGSDYDWINASSGGGSFGNSDVDTHLNISGANSNEVLQWNGSDYAWTALPSGGVTSLLNLSDVGSDGTNGQVLTTDGSGSFSFTTISGGGGGSYSDTDVSAHLNTGSASADQILSWTGSDFAWVADATGGGGSSTLAALTEVNTADLDIHDMAATAVTTYYVVGPDSSKYTMDQLPGDNPTVYVQAGQTVAFELNGATSMHPFEIRSDASTPYNTGLVHYANDGTKTTGTNAQGKTEGTLYWKVPGNISGTYKYICTSHSSMIGDIVIADPSASGGGSGASRVSEAETTASISDGASGSVEYATLGKSFALQKITVDKQCWVRIYSDTASRTADASRVQGTDPADGSGVIAEIISTTAGTQVFKLTPGIFGWLDNSETEVPVAIQNNSGSTGTVTVTIAALKLES